MNRPDPDMKISIGTLSKAFDLSDEALRFYEKKGLIHPERKGDSGYRIFERTDIQRIANIKRLKNLGFALDEIHSVYSCMSEEKLHALLSAKILESQREMLRHAHLIDHAQHALNTLDEAPGQLEMPCLMNMDVAYVLEYDSIQAMWQQLPHDSTLKALFQELPLSTFTTLINRGVLTGDPCRVRKGILVFERDADVLDIDRSMFRRIDARRAVGCLFRLTDGKFILSDLLGRLAQFLTANRLTAADDLFTAQLLSFVDDQEHAIHYARMLVPLAPA